MINKILEEIEKAKKNRSSMSVTAASNYWHYDGVIQGLLKANTIINNHCKLPWKRLASIYREDYNTIAEDHHRQCKYINQLCEFLEDKNLIKEFMRTKGKANYELAVHQKKGISSNQN